MNVYISGGDVYLYIQLGEVISSLFLQRIGSFDDSAASVIESVDIADSESKSLRLKAS